MNGNVLVVAAHPDDEVLGCGGTLARHAKAGDRVEVLILSDGVGSRARDGESFEKELSVRQADANAAAKALGISAPRLLGFPDNRLDTVPLLDVVKAIEACIVDVCPHVVYTHHGGDLNIDHQIAHRAVVTACRPVPGSLLNAIYTFETPSSTDWLTPQQSEMFVPTRFVDVSETISHKMAALRSYGTEMRDFPHTRSYEAIEGLARVRGGQAGLIAAEAFGVLREVVRL
jgi:LmbE family N-acetylglucosaminyl deacetylase